MCSSASSPSWDTIIYCLKNLDIECDTIERDLNVVGTTLRLKFQDFERIVYQLFYVINKIECRKRFRGIYPVGGQDNREQREKFIQQTMLFINEKVLNSSRISTSQLRMCGGEPFRRLLGQLIERATELEIQRKSKLMIIQNNPDCSSGGLQSGGSSSSNKELELEDPFSLNELEKIESKLEELEEELNSRRNLLLKLERDTKEKKKILNEMLPTRNKLFARVKESIDKTNAIIDKLPLSTTTTGVDDTNQLALQSSRTNNNNINNSLYNKTKRISQLIREVQETNSGGGEENKLIEQMRENDRKMDKLILDWKNQVFQSPSMQEKYLLLKKLLPLAPIKPIEWPGKA